MRSVAMGIALLLIGFAAQANTIDFNYEKPEEISKVINDYAKLTGTKWIIDPMVRGRITIINPKKVEEEEAFHQLASAMAINGLAYTEDEGSYKVSQSRQIQRSNIPVVKDLPPLKPERMVTWIVTLRNVSADEVQKQVRTMNSKDGECAAMTDTNQMIFSDYTSSIHRIAKVIAELDQPLDADRAKIVEKSKKAQAVREASRPKPSYTGH